MRTWLTMLSLLLTVSLANAATLRDPRKVVYDGKKIWVRIAADQITRLVLPAPLTLQSFAVSPSVATLSTETTDPRQLIIHAVNPQGQVHLTVNTTRQAYVVVLRRAEKSADSVVTVVHPPPPAPKRHAAPNPQVAMRQFWLSQWWGRSLSPAIRVKPVAGFVQHSETQETQYVAYQCGLGFYGWTLRITNKSERPQVVDIESLQDVSGRLLSVMPQRSDAAREMGRLAPGQSMLLHLAYMENTRW